MKVKIKSISEKGSYDKEYVTLEVLESCDIGRYMLSDSTYTSAVSLSNKIRHIYWFLTSMSPGATSSGYLREANAAVTRMSGVIRPSLLPTPFTETSRWLSGTTTRTTPSCSK